MCVGRQTRDRQRLEKVKTIASKRSTGGQLRILASSDPLRPTSRHRKGRQHKMCQSDCSIRGRNVLSGTKINQARRNFRLKGKRFTSE